MKQDVFLGQVVQRCCKTREVGYEFTKIIRKSQELENTCRTGGEFPISERADFIWISTYAFFRKYVP